ncbi:MAG: hypothetical protein ABIY51_04275 [Ferruginibacter sp.]
MKKNSLSLLLTVCSIFYSCILHAQNVGIGIALPTERLHVVHTSDINKSTVFGYASQLSSSTDYQNTGIAGFGQGNGTAGGWGYGFGVKGIGSLNSYGAVGVYAGLASNIPQNIVLLNSFYSLYADVGAPANNRYAAVFLNGNVGIGTTAPGYKLDISGDANITGALRTNGDPGVAGQVLGSNGTGTPTWQATALANNTRFFSGFDLTGNGNLNFGTVIYNTNPTNITINPGSITINHTGLYHIEGFIQRTITLAAPQTYAPTFTLVMQGLGIILLMDDALSQTSSVAYRKGQNVYLDMYFVAGTTLSFNASYSAAGTSSTGGYISGYLISD